MAGITLASGTIPTWMTSRFLFLVLGLRGFRFGIWGLCQSL
jgi:hypothetical protein